MAKVAFLDGASNETLLDGLSRAITQIIIQSGVVLSTDLLVTENDTPGANVKVAVGKALIGFDVYTDPQEKYYSLFADSEEVVTITANSSGNDRIDAIVAYVDTSAAGADDNDGAGVFAAIAGTPAASPAAPTDAAIQTALGAGVRWIRLANVDVANGFSSILDADITSTRVQSFIDGKLVGSENYTTRAYLSTNQTSVTDGTKILLNTVSTNTDNGGNFDTGNSRFVAPVSGMYLVLPRVRVSNPTDGVRYGYTVKLNGSTTVDSFNIGCALTAAAQTFSGAGNIVYMDKDDYIELYYYTSSGSNTISGGETSTAMSIFLITAM